MNRMMVLIPIHGLVMAMVQGVVMYTVIVQQLNQHLQVVQGYLLCMYQHPAPQPR